MRGSVFQLALCLAVAFPGRADAAAGNTITFSGKVTDAGGKPAAGATVVANVWDPPRSLRDWSRRPTRHQTTAGADGSFRLVMPVSSGEWEATLIALKDRHGPGGEQILSPGHTTGLTLSLTRPSFVAGKVTDRAGGPVAGATVGVQWAACPDFDGPLQLEGTGPTAITDPQGRFRLGPLPAGAGLSLFANHPGYAPVRSTPERIASEADEVTIALPPPSTVVGQVIANNGKPAPNVTVHCHSFGAAVPDVVTDAEGRYRFGRLPGGNYLFHAVLPGDPPELVSELQGVAIPEGGEKRCPDLHLVRGGVVTGRVTDEKGQPMAGVEIISRREFAVADLWMIAFGPKTRTAADGTYRLRLPPAGGDTPHAVPGSPDGWHVQADLFPQGAFGEEEERTPKPGITVTAGQTIRVDLTTPRPALLRARVLDASGRPAAAAMAQITKGWRLETQKTDAAGRFAVSRLVPTQPATLLVFSRDRRQRARLEVVPARVKGELVIHLQELPAVTGTVRDTNSGPIAGAWVGAERILRHGLGWGVEQTNQTSTDARAAPEERGYAGEADRQRAVPLWLKLRLRALVESARRGVWQAEGDTRAAGGAVPRESAAGRVHGAVG